MQIYNLNQYLRVIFFTCLFVLSFLIVPVSNAGPVRAQTAAIRSTNPATALRSSFVDAYEQRVFRAAANDEAYAEKYSRWKSQVSRQKYKSTKQDLDRLRKERDKEEMERRRKANQFAKETSRNKRRGVQEEGPASIKRTAPLVESKQEASIAKENVAVGTESPAKKGWSLWGSKSTEENVESGSEESEAADSKLETKTSEPKTRRSLWGHLKKALW